MSDVFWFPQVSFLGGGEGRNRRVAGRGEAGVISTFRFQGQFNPAYLGIDIALARHCYCPLLLIGILLAMFSMHIWVYGMFSTGACFLECKPRGNSLRSLLLSVVEVLCASL